MNGYSLVLGMVLGQSLGLWLVAVVVTVVVSCGEMVALAVVVVSCGKVVGVVASEIGSKVILMGHEIVKLLRPSSALV